MEIPLSCRIALISLLAILFFGTARIKEYLVWAKLFKF
jgi:hypothetical protein